MAKVGLHSHSYSLKEYLRPSDSSNVNEMDSSIVRNKAITIATSCMAVISVVAPVVGMGNPGQAASPSITATHHASLTNSSPTQNATVQTTSTFSWPAPLPTSIPPVRYLPVVSPVPGQQVVQPNVTIADGAHPVDVCAVLYLWYGYNQTTGKWTGGYGTSHWGNGPDGVIDGAPAGYYASISQIPTQLEQMASNGINCAELDSLGPTASTTSLTAAVNNAVQMAFVDAQNIHGFKLFMLEDLNRPLTASSYGPIYQSVNSTYAKYPNQVLQFDGANLLTFFNTPNSVSPPPSPGLTIRVIGNNNDEISPGWWFWGAPARFFTSFGGTMTSPCNAGYCNEPSVSPDGFVSVTPSYNDIDLYHSGARSGYMQLDPDDPNYTENLYQYEWNYVINHSERLVEIDSYNEDHEGSGIEDEPKLLAQTKADIAALERGN